MLFRVWDKQKKSWGTDTYYLNEDGDLLYDAIDDLTYININSVDLEFNTGITLADGTETFFGDIVRVTDSNWGYGGEYDRTHDGYLYAVITKNNFCDMVTYWSGEGSVWRSDMECVGNIHETELTDAMKVWIGGSK